MRFYVDHSSNLKDTEFSAALPAWVIATFSKSNILALSKTQVTNLCDKSDFHIGGYSVVTNSFSHPVSCIYVRENISFARLPQMNSEQPQILMSCGLRLTFKNI